MMDINLLPWRERKRRRQLRNKIIVGSVLVTVIVSLCVYHYCYSPSQAQSSSPSSSFIDTPKWQSSLEQIRFVGFVRQQKRIWALLRLPDGKTVDVQIGSVITEAALPVIAINEKQLLLQLPHQQLFAITYAGR